MNPSLALTLEFRAMKPLLLALLLAAAASADPRVMGQILDSEARDGGVVEFSILRIKGPDDPNGTPIAVKTDRSGRFELTLAPGRYRMGPIRKPIEKDKRLSEANFEGEEFEITNGEMFDLGFFKLEKTGTYVTGTVKRGGKAVAAVDVEVFDAGAGVGTGVKATTDAAGKFELVLPDVKGPQSVAVTIVEKEGQSYAKGSVDLWKPSTLDITLPEKYAEIMVDLTAPGETWVYFHPKGESAPYVLHKLKAGAKAQIPGFAPGAWTLTALSGGVQVDLDATLPSATPFALNVPGAKRHKVDGKVSIVGLGADFDWDNAAVVAKPAGASASGYLFAPLAEGGAFSFDGGLAAGKYELSVAVGKRHDAIRWFEAKRSAVAMSVFELGAPRTIDLSIRAGDLR